MAGWPLLAQTATPRTLVHLRLAASDSNGQPVGDLSAADFQVWDQGKLESVVAFQRHVMKVAGPLRPHEFSNRLGGLMPQHTAILFDLLNQSRSERVENWHNLSKSIAQLAAGDAVSVYLLNLEGELVTVHGEEPKTEWQAVALALDQMVKAAGPTKPVHLGAEEVVKKTYHQMEVLAKTLSALPGWRDIVWIADNVPSVYNPNVPCRGDWVDCALYVPHLAVTLAQTGVAVSPLSYSGDVRSAVDPELEHVRPKVQGAADAAGQGIATSMSLSQPAGVQPGAVVPHMPEGHPELDLAKMALLSGGRAFFQKDVRSVLKDVRAGGASVYELDYDPGAANWDKKFHHVRVGCERKGVKLDFRERYFALADARLPTDRVRAALLEALQSGHDAVEIGITSQVGPLPEGTAGVHLDLTIDASNLLLVEQGGKYAGAIDLLISDRGAAGVIGEPKVASFDLSFTAAQYEAVLKEGIRIEQDHLLNDATQTVRVVVVDQNRMLRGL